MRNISLVKLQMLLDCFSRNAFKSRNIKSFGFKFCHKSSISSRSENWCQFLLRDIILVVNKRLKIKTFVLVLLFGLAVLAVYVFKQEARNGILTVAFLNIGQGDAIFIESPTGNQML